MSTFRLAVLLSAIVAVPHGSEAADKKKDNRAPASSATETTTAKSGAITGSATPVTHALLGEDRSNPERRVLTVGIDRRASSTELTSIARGVFKPAAGSRETALVNFQLDADRGADQVWAVVRVGIGADIKVQFIGLSQDEITQLRAEAANDNRAVIGSWLTQPPLSTGRITMFRDGGAPFLEWRLRGGTRTTIEMVETRQQGTIVFTDKTGGDERFVLNANGDLEVRDGQQTLVAIGQKIEAFAPTAAPSLALAKGRGRAVVTKASGTRSASVQTASADLLAPPPPPENKPQPRFTGKRSIVPPTWQVRILR